MTTGLLQYGIVRYNLIQSTTKGITLLPSISFLTLNNIYNKNSYPASAGFRGKKSQAQTLTGAQIL